VIDRFVDIGGIVDHHCFKLSFHNKSVGTLQARVLVRNSMENCFQIGLKIHLSFGRSWFPLISFILKTIKAR
jgi:hypothetical protein